MTGKGPAGAQKYKPGVDGETPRESPRSSPERCHKWVPGIFRKQNRQVTRKTLKK